MESYFVFRRVNGSLEHQLLQQLLKSYPGMGIYARPRVKYQDTVFIDIDILLFGVTRVDQSTQTVTFISLNQNVSKITKLI